MFENGGPNTKHSRLPSQADISKILDDHGVSPFQRPYVLQRWSEQLAGKEPTFKTIPVDIRTFIEHPEYMNKGGSTEQPVVYPRVMDELEECNTGKYVEGVFTGGIGSGKSTAALYTTTYQAYLLGCMANPHRTFGLDPSSEILFIFQSITATLAKAVDYNRFRDMVRESPWFQNNFMFRTDLESKMEFPGRFEVVPVAGTETAAIGQNVMGGIIDELNYMSVVQKSSKSMDKGVYDQAVALYDSISRRRKSRFMNQGRLPGVLCLVSSKRYPGQFTDTKEAEAKSDPTIFIYDKRTWEIAPERYSGKTFQVFTGGPTRRPRVLQPHETLADEDAHLAMAIPVEHRIDFDKDIINALREVAGVATLARHPFILNTDSINAAMTGGNKATAPLTDFNTYKVGLESDWALKSAPRFAHVDLGITSDHAGVVIGHVKEFKSMERSDGIHETLPVVEIDLVLGVAPPVNGEINFEKIRQLFYIVRDKLRIPLRWVTYDSFQSVDSLQILRGKGFTTGQTSMDKTPYAYELMKSAMYDSRLIMPQHDKLALELASLERDPMTGKIDHPPRGSKDLSDCVAGVVYGLTMRREIWTGHNIPPAMVPAWLLDAGKMASKLDTDA